MALLTRFIEGLLPKEYKLSHSQCGEDLIARFVFDALGIEKPSYLDIGAYHPAYLSNTFLFYRQQGRGVLVEPDPILFAEIKKVRTRDTCLNAGVGTGRADKADFYIMTTKTLNTFSKQDAEKYQEYGNQKIERIIQVPLLSINAIIKEHFASPPNFVSIDIEGLDLEVLKTFDFTASRPEVFCIETLTYTEDKTEEKIEEIAELMIGNGYLAYADTYINTIFIDKAAWLNRKS